MDWFGADPGGTRNGKPCFGVAWIRKNGMFETSSTDCAHGAFRWIQKHSVVPLAMGIDSPLWWSSLKGGERQVDVLLRKKYRDSIGQSVQSLNSLPGAVLVQGMMLACESRKHWKDLKITETHPRALLKAMHLNKESPGQQSRESLIWTDPSLKRMINWMPYSPRQLRGTGTSTFGQ
jgi:predicted nuclease with RNAse H fold